MLVDLVLDANVLVHANNGKEKRQQSSIDLIMYLLGSTERICVDEGFSLNETTNKSYIGYEYLKHLKYGQLGYALISTLAQTKRVSEVSREVGRHVTQKINQCMSNNHDRVFIKVALNSIEKVLVSHDFTDFTAAKRRHLKKTFGVNVLVAQDVP